MLIYFANIIGLILLHYFFYKKKISTLETYCWIFTTFYLSVFIGLRYEVGGDWSIYLNFFDEYNQLFNINLLSTFLDHGLFYVIINKISYYIGSGYIGVNFICAIIFMTALSSFLYSSKNRWLGMLVSFPIIIVILGMGYTRQGLAFAFSLLLLKSLENNRLYLSFIYLILAILSHQTALMLLSFFIFYFWYHKKYSDLIKLIIIPIFFGFIFWDKLAHLLYFYVGSGQHMTAFGSIPRASLIIIIAVLFLFFRKKHVYMTKYQIYIFTWIAYLIIVIAPFSFVSTITTDRLLFYLYSLKVAFISFANLEDKKINAVVFFIISIYVFYLAVWMHFGHNSSSWVPYNFVGS